jgi:hypothetical protein
MDCLHLASVQYVPEFAAEGDPQPYLCNQCGTRMSRADVDDANKRLIRRANLEG